jgi:hypothetical protein
MTGYIGRLGRYLILTGAGIAASTQIAAAQLPQDTIVIGEGKKQYRIEMDQVEKLETLTGIGLGKIEVFYDDSELKKGNKKIIVYGKYKSPGNGYKDLMGAIKDADSDGDGNKILTDEELENRYNSVIKQKLGESGKGF